ncbi:hypothetical protein AN958_12593, partial [Leucoagaricus sp. SymC.cos]
LTENFRKFIINCAVYVYNRTLVQCFIWKTSIEVASGQKPDVSYLKVFSCDIYVFISEEIHKNKLTT